MCFCIVVVKNDSLTIRRFSCIVVFKLFICWQYLPELIVWLTTNSWKNELLLCNPAKQKASHFQDANWLLPCVLHAHLLVFKCIWIEYYCTRSIFYRQSSKNGSLFSRSSKKIAAETWLNLFVSFNAALIYRASKCIQSFLNAEMQSIC